MRYVIQLAATVYLGVVAAVPAHAQLTGYYPSGTDSASLNNDDFRLLVDAANGLLRRSPLPVGATTSWRNAQTGSTGTIRAARTFRRQAMLCHTLVYETAPAGTASANRTTLDWCNVGGGAWKILSP